MLLELQISDFAIIDRLTLRLGDGFNVLTGETGAGKSIIIDALGMLRGERPDPTFVRAGASRARVEGLFGLIDSPQVVPLLREYGLYDDDDDQVILTREISAESGRSVARINGRAVSASILREIGSQLLDIHGQHDGLSLFNARTHLDLLDRFGELMPLRQQVTEQVERLRSIRSQLAELRRSEARRHERIEELRFLIEDVNQAALRPGEEEELLRERGVVQNGARITGLVNAAYAKLYTGDESERNSEAPVVETMALVLTAIEELARYDEQINPLLQQASDLHYQLEELAASVRAYRDQLDFEPGRLDAIEDRLTVIRDLQRKYGLSIEALLERAAGAESEIERLTNSAEHMAELENQEQRLLQHLGQLTGELSQRRRGIGEELAQQIEGSMADLAMARVRFAVQFQQHEASDGVPVGDRYLACERHGVDRVEFMISPNPGEPLKPLAKIASGGESARLLLALKAILSRVDEVATLIFDEIDVGVGGRAGQVVGQKLWTISNLHQVICISHLPQVAAFADSHYHINKEFEHERTRTRIHRLDTEQQIDELAAMLDGTPVSDYSRGNAQAIVERALSYKRESLANPAETTHS